MLRAFPQNLFFSFSFFLKLDGPGWDFFFFFQCTAAQPAARVKTLVARLPRHSSQKAAAVGAQMEAAERGTVPVGWLERRRLPVRWQQQRSTPMCTVRRQAHGGHATGGERCTEEVRQADARVATSAAAREAHRAGVRATTGATGQWPRLARRHTGASGPVLNND